MITLPILCYASLQITHDTYNHPYIPFVVNQDSDPNPISLTKLPDNPERKEETCLKANVLLS